MSLRNKWDIKEIFQTFSSIPFFGDHVIIFSFDLLWKPWVFLRRPHAAAPVGLQVQSLMLLHHKVSSFFYRKLSGCRLFVEVTSPLWLFIGSSWLLKVDYVLGWVTKWYLYLPVSQKRGTTCELKERSGEATGTSDVTSRHPELLKELLLYQSSNDRWHVIFTLSSLILK